MQLRRGNVWALAAVLGSALAGTAVVQGCGGDDTVANTNTDAGTTSTTVDSGAPAPGLTCAAPATKCGEACVDTKNDPKNCGACGTACAAGLTCSDGACALACTGGATKCGDACVDTDVDAKNCGGCGTACKAGEVCSNGTCGLTCAQPLATCGANADAGAAQSFCAKTQSDSDNCGTCGNACAANERCVAGACAVGCSTGADCKSTSALCSANKCSVPRDCADIKQSNPAALSGVYTIDPDGAAGVAAFPVYCDMATDGGGWTIVASMTGADGEEGLTSDTAAAGNPLTFGRFNLTRAQKKALSNLETESLFLRNNGQWLVADKPMFASGAGKDLTVADSNDEFAVNLRYQAAGIGAATPGFIGWSTHLIAGGGDFGVSQSPDFTTCGGAYNTTNGFDHHNTTNYYQLNCNCEGQYLYSYSNNAADGDASYKAGVSLGSWAANNSCGSSEGGGLAFYAAMRRPVALGTSCKAIKTATPSAPDGWYTIDTDGAGANPAVGVYCDMTTDGGGYTMLPIRNGISTFRFDEANSCAGAGLSIIVPRTKAHLAKMTSSYPGFFGTIPGIYRDVDPANGNPNYSTGDYAGNVADPCAMRSGDQTKCSTDWKAVGGGAWFVRDVNYSEPNSDYTQGCWLGWNGQVDADGAVSWNDGNCGYQTGSQYVCSDNAK